MSRPGSLQISERLRRSIIRAERRPGEQLPAISALAREYGCTPVTVRRALRTLEEEGLVRVEHGVGTFVADWSGGYDFHSIPSFSAELGGREPTLDTRLLLMEEAVRNPEAAACLGLEPEAPVDALTRLRLASGLPVAHQTSYLSPELRAVVRDYTEDRSLYELLRERTARAPVSAQERLQAVRLPREVARLLQVPDGAVGWRSVRTTLDAASRPLVFDEAFFPAERMQLQVTRRAGQAMMEYAITLPASVRDDSRTEE